MPDIVIRYEWANKTNSTKNCIVYFNMTKKIFWAYKPAMFSTKKNNNVCNNNDCLFYHVDLKDKTSFNDLVDALRKTDFEQI